MGSKFIECCIVNAIVGMIIASACAAQSAPQVRALGSAVNQKVELHPSSMEPPSDSDPTPQLFASSPEQSENPEPQITTLPANRKLAPQVDSNGFGGRWQARATATQNEQPHWITPLVTVTPRLEQEFRTDFVHYYNPSGHEIWNYGNGKGLELIPEKHTEIIFNIPPFLDRSNGESDGFGDVSFLLKERLYSRNESHGNAIVTAFLGASVPTGKNGNGSCCAVVTPTLAIGKGWANFDLTSTAGGSLPVSNAAGLGRSVIWNNVVQYRLAKTGTARLFWPEFETNTTIYKGGPNDGKTQTFGTPGLIIGRIPLSHHSNGTPGRLGLTFGAGEQIALTRFHTVNHYTVLTFRIPF